MLVYQRATAGENFKVHFLPQGVSTKWLQITLQTGKLMYFSGGSDKRNIDLGIGCPHITTRQEPVEVVGLCRRKRCFPNHPIRGLVAVLE